MRELFEPQHTKLLNLTDGSTEIKLETTDQSIHPVILTTKVSLSDTKETFIGQIPEDEEKTVRITVTLYNVLDRVRSSEVIIKSEGSSEQSLGELKKITTLS